MNRISINNKLLSRIIITSFSLLILLAISMSFMTSPGLSQPVFLIISLESDLEETNRKEVKSWLGINSKDNNFKILREDAAPIIIGTPELLTQLDSVLKDGTMSNYLFKLDKPTGFNKKKLRQDIETKFHGVERRNVLRHVIVVVELEVPGTNDAYEPDYQQFEDDLIYFQDNFGGVGLLVNNIEQNIFENYGKIIQQILMTTDN